jgi:hypothetical protein
MDTFRKLTLLVGAAMLSLALVAGPAFAVEGEADTTTTEAPAEEDSGRIQLTETPRDRVGLLLLGALVVGGGLAWANARRQLKGERPQATGEFRWR